MRRSLVSQLLRPSVHARTPSATELVDAARAVFPDGALPGDDPSVPLLPARKALDEALRALRDVERELPWLPKFDAKTLPARLEGENEFTWRDRQLDALREWNASNLSSLRSRR